MGLLKNILKTKDDEKEVVNNVDGLENSASDKITKASVSPKKQSNSASKKDKVVKSGEDTKDAYKVLVGPLVSEKAALGESVGQYTFIVNSRANKSEVKKAVFAVYGVKPLSVNILNVGGKDVRYGRTAGKKKDWRKAVVTLPKDKKIQIYEGV